MRLWLVRHGESTWNVEKRLQGQTPGVPLTPRGQEQARECARLLGRVGRQRPSRLWSSDLQRAWQTAQPIGLALGVEPVVDERLREQHYGELQGRLTRELTPQPVPEGKDITEVAWGGGESIEQVYARVRALLIDLASDPVGTVLVTHGDTLRVALTAIDQLNRGEPDARPHRLVEWPVVANGAVIARDLSQPSRSATSAAQ